MGRKRQVALTTSGRAGGGPELEQKCRRASGDVRRPGAETGPAVCGPRQASVSERVERPSGRGSLDEPTNEMCAERRDGAGVKPALGDGADGPGSPWHTHRLRTVPAARPPLEPPVPPRGCSLTVCGGSLTPLCPACSGQATCRRFSSFVMGNNSVEMDGMSPKRHF